MRFLATFLTILIVLAASPLSADTTITYQGQLQDASGPYTGTPGMIFRLYGSLSGDNQIGGEESFSGVPVEDGLFQVELDFGEGAFDGGARWLEIEVAGSVVEPRQPILSVPIAVHASNLSSGAVDDQYWRRGGNVEIGTGDFLGTIDDSPFEIYVHEERALRIEPSALGEFAPNVIAGHEVNAVEDGVYGATIGGGGLADFHQEYPNVVSRNGSTISGGMGNTASGGVSTIGGGSENKAGSAFATVGGGQQNQASEAWAVIGGGRQNIASGSYATIGGGQSNIASTWYTTVGGGIDNLASGLPSTVPGGRDNTASGDYSFAAGRRAKAEHDGAFVWADDIDADFPSTGEKQFLIRAGGGVGINTNSPEAPLHVASSNNWNLSSTEGDFKVGNDTYRFKLGVSLGGAGAGNVRLRAQGGSNKLILGSNESDVLVIHDADGVSPGTDNQYPLGSSSSRWTSVWATDGTINTSDRRLKRDIEPLSGGVETVEALRAVTYRWKDQPESGNRPGLVAQEVREVLPEVVAEAADDDGMLGVRYADLIPVLVSAIQDQQAQLHGLKSENAELRGLAERNAKLEDRLATLEALLLEDRQVAGGQQ